MMSVLKQPHATSFVEDMWCGLSLKKAKQSGERLMDFPTMTFWTLTLLSVYF